jgi:hypothetical protein
MAMSSSSIYTTTRLFYTSPIVPSIKPFRQTRSARCSSSLHLSIGEGHQQALYPGDTGNLAPEIVGASDNKRAITKPVMGDR